MRLFRSRCRWSNLPKNCCCFQKKYAKSHLWHKSMPMWFPTSFTILLFIIQICKSLKCYSCRHSLRNKDVLDGIDVNPGCMSFEKFYNNSAYVRTCGLKETQCMVSFCILNLNGIHLWIYKRYV